MVSSTPAAMPSFAATSTAAWHRALSGACSQGCAQEWRMSRLSPLGICSGTSAVKSVPKGLGQGEGRDLQELALQVCEAAAEVEANGSRIGVAGMVDVALNGEVLKSGWQ
jgi:hypothetical protein